MIDTSARIAHKRGLILDVISRERAQDAFDETDRYSRSDWEVQRASYRSGGTNGENAMRSVTALCLLITLCASTDAAAAHRSRPLHVIVRDKHGLNLGFAAPGWTRSGPRIHYRETPSYDDPSKYGGGEARPVQ